MTGKISPLQAIDNVERAAVAAIADICTTGLPAKLLTSVPVVGPALSVVVDGVLTQCSSKIVQEKIHTGIKKAKEVVSDAVTIVKKGINKVFKEAKELGSKALSVLFSV